MWSYKASPGAKTFGNCWSMETWQLRCAWLSVPGTNSIARGRGTVRTAGARTHRVMAPPACLQSHSRQQWQVAVIAGMALTVSVCVTNTAHCGTCSMHPNCPPLALLLLGTMFLSENDHIAVLVFLVLCTLVPRRAFRRASQQRQPQLPQGHGKRLSSAPYLREGKEQAAEAQEGAEVEGGKEAGGQVRAPWVARPHFSRRPSRSGWEAIGTPGLGGSPLGRFPWRCCDTGRGGRGFSAAEPCRGGSQEGEP